MKKYVLAAALALGCQQREAAPDKASAPAPSTPSPAAAPAANPASAAGSAEGARDYITIVGSSTVYPFSTVVAEQFGKTSKFKAPKVEATGTGGGLKLFCDGVGVKFPDIANASRRIKESEVATCKQHGVADIIELKIGYDGIVLANSKKGKPLDIAVAHLWLALAKEVPDGTAGEKLKPNPYEKWSEIDSKLPAVEIEVLGPPPTSGTRDAFVELAMEQGCSAVPWIKALKTSDEKRFKAICHTIREDGTFIEAGENDNLIVQKLEANPAAFGVFGYSFLEQNAEKVQGSTIEGVAPTFETISGGKYPVSRPLYIYVKKAHTGVIPGIAEYLAEFTSPRAAGPDGYLADKGLIPMPDEERTRYRNVATNLTPLTM